MHTGGPWGTLGSIEVFDMSEAQAQVSESLNKPVVESTETPAPVAPAVAASEGGYTTSRLEATLLRFGTLGELMALFIRAKRWWMLARGSLVCRPPMQAAPGDEPVHPGRQEAGGEDAGGEAGGEDDDAPRRRRPRHGRALRRARGFPA